MDVYDSDFHDSIALDTRVQNITKALGFVFSNYHEGEVFYQGIAKEAGINCWELDRLLFNFNDYFLTNLRQTEFLDFSKKCPKCGKAFQHDYLFCPFDKTKLKKQKM